ncbi:MAG: hypothetical protein IJD85_08480 [Oscillospiraceae bacterium]|nr:hypothetical protein [Oscillospiraceae bacterium]
MSKNTKSMAPMISTIIVAVLAIGVVIAALILISGDKGGESSVPDSSVSEQRFQPTQELLDECTYAAHDLVANNYQIVRLFVTEGLPYEPEPYGNAPEDGLYTVSSKDYTTLEEIESLVKDTFVADEAQRILTDIDGNKLAVYQTREKLVKVEQPADSTAEAEEDASIQYTTEYVLGISAKFTPAKDYKKDWSSCRIALVPKSETECKLTVYLDGVDENTATEADADSVLDMFMTKSGDEWRLTEFVY